jgi:hypothetical protein
MLRIVCPETFNELLLLVSRCSVAPGAGGKSAEKPSTPCVERPFAMERCLEMRRRAPGTDQVYATLVIRKVGLGGRYRAHGLRQRRAFWR